MGSRPIARSQMPKGIFYYYRNLIDKEIGAHYNLFCSGDVAKWEGKGLQNPHHGFKSRRRLKRRQVKTCLLIFCLNRFPAGLFDPLVHYKDFLHGLLSSAM